MEYQRLYDAKATFMFEHTRKPIQIINKAESAHVGRSLRSPHVIECLGDLMVHAWRAGAPPLGQRAGVHRRGGAVVAATTLFPRRGRIG